MGGSLDTWGHTIQDVALAIDHGRGAVNRAMDSIVAKGGAKDVGQSHYVRVVA